MEEKARRNLGCRRAAGNVSHRSPLTRENFHLYQDEMEREAAMPRVCHIPSRVSLERNARSHESHMSIALADIMSGRCTIARFQHSSSPYSRDLTHQAFSSVRLISQVADALLHDHHILPLVWMEKREILFNYPFSSVRLIS